jgi:Type IV secretion-system coupling protein DNA-binding domain
MNGRLKRRMPFRRRVTASVRDYFGLEESPTWITIPRAEETEHIMLLGDPGTGKSQTIHHFLLQIATRQPAEAVVIYDPACEFIKRHYNEQRGDVILNPTDQRSPYWSPSVELHTLTDKKLLAESFLPGKPDTQQASSSGFFLKAARAIFGRMLELKPTPAQMVQWIKSEDAIDTMVTGTEHTHLIPKNAHGQRAGVLGVLSELGDILRLLPERAACASEISLSEWVRRRRGWIFITSRTDMREALRPLQAAFINILMKRLMSVSPEWGQAHPCWVIVDEVHSLHRLPALYETETEGRKYGVKLIQGTQGKTQYEEYYDRLAKAMLAAPKLKLFFRCGESESARWISDTIGEYEVEKPRIATTASVDDRGGRDALNYSTMTEHHQAISKEEIMCLPDLHGYWKYGDAVVPFRLPLAPVKIVTRGYIPRELAPRKINPPSLLEALSVGREKPSNEDQGIKTVDRPRMLPQDIREHKHVIAENEIHILNASDLNTAEFVHGNNQSEITITEATEEPSQTSSVETEIGGF